MIPNNQSLFLLEVYLWPFFLWRGYPNGILQDMANPSENTRLHPHLVEVKQGRKMKHKTLESKPKACAKDDPTP